MEHVLPICQQYHRRHSTESEPNTDIITPTHWRPKEAAVMVVVGHASRLSFYIHLTPA